MSTGFTKEIREISLLFFGVGVACYCDTIPAPIRWAWCTIPSAGPGVFVFLAAGPAGDMRNRPGPGDEFHRRKNEKRRPPDNPRAA